jgi:hypothetical protein
MKADTSLLQDLQARNNPFDIILNQLPRTVVGAQGRPTLKIEAADL